MWNDTETPLAIFFTLRTYGTWLHGDIRGSVDRANNLYRAPRIEPNSNWRKYNEQRLLHPPFLLNAACRNSVEESIFETCLRRDWCLHAINVRTNHAHSVIDIGAKEPALALIALKANATRRLREDGLSTYEHSPWAEKGSKRRLWHEKSVSEACNYVNNRQGADLPRDEG
jgi:REP element-mobilizing transposase RayT